MNGSSDLPHEPRFRFEGTDLEALLDEWRLLGRDCLEEAVRRLRDHPEECAALAFLAGTIAGALLGRRG